MFCNPDFKIPQHTYFKPLKPDFPLTLARWPMASEHCWRTSDFLSYCPGLPSGISTIAINFKKRKTKLFFLKKSPDLQKSQERVMWPSIKLITDPNSL